MESTYCSREFHATAESTKTVRDPASTPKRPLPKCRVPDELPEAELINPLLPVIAGRPSQHGGWFSQVEEGLWYLGLDVLGAVFFMLSRYEEVVIGERDAHDRFSARSSLASKEGFLERPVVDEYIELLFSVMKRIWPGLAKARPAGRILPTCDVDSPYDTRSRSVAVLFGGVGWGILRRPRSTMAVKRVRNVWLSRKHDSSQDVKNTFDWMMDGTEARGCPMVFYFIAGAYESAEPTSPEIRRRPPLPLAQHALHAARGPTVLQSVADLMLDSPTNVHESLSSGTRHSTYCVMLISA